MPSFLSNFFNTKGSIDEPLSATRKVNLCGNYFSFAMPEDFSQDMPAENLIENLDITDLEKFDDPEYGNLIRRWWDIREPGLFGKNLGSVMMDISVQRVPKNNRKKIHSDPYNILDRLDFLLMINEFLHQRYDDLITQTEGLSDDMRYTIPGVAYLIGKKLETEYRDYIYNSQKWIGYSASAPINQLIVGLVTPLSTGLYIEVIFSYAPSQGILPRRFLDVAREKTIEISKTLTVEYEEKNAIKPSLMKKDWQTLTNNQIVQRNQDTLLVPLFGPDIHTRLALQDQQIAETMKALAKQDEEAE